MITKIRIAKIAVSDYIFDTLKVVRRGNVFDIFDTTAEHLFTGNAENCARFLNKYFNLIRR